MLDVAESDIQLKLIVLFYLGGALPYLVFKTPSFLH